MESYEGAAVGDHVLWLGRDKSDKRRIGISFFLVFVGTEMRDENTEHLKK